jgi:hypothetical protein
VWFFFFFFFFFLVWWGVGGGGGGGGLGDSLCLVTCWQWWLSSLYLFFQILSLFTILGLTLISLLHDPFLFPFFFPQFSSCLGRSIYSFSNFGVASPCFDCAHQLQSPCFPTTNEGTPTHHCQMCCVYIDETWCAMAACTPLPRSSPQIHKNLSCS